MARLKQKIVHKWLKGLRFVTFVVNHFIEDDCPYRASALAFTSLLAIVPLMTVSLAILSSFPVFHNFVGPIQNFIFENFVPATGKTVQSYLLFFTLQVSKLSILGITFLFVTAFLVMFTIERSMNKIWRVNTARNGVSAFLLYWAILSLAPILLGLSFAASSYFYSILYLKGFHAPSFLMAMIPFLLSLVGFTFLYLVVPNCQVKFSHAFYGALFATILIEASKQAFAFYLTQFNVYQLLFGAFAAIPLFFIWIYWVWFITLVGAEMSYAFSVHYERRVGTPVDGFSHALLWLHALWQAHQRGDGLDLNALIDVTHRPYEVEVGEMVDTLLHAKLIIMTSRGKLSLNRDLSLVTLYDLMQWLPYKWPLETTTDLILNEHWSHGFKRTLEEKLEISLEQVFEMNVKKIK